MSHELVELEHRLALVAADLRAVFRNELQPLCQPRIRVLQLRVDDLRRFGVFLPASGERGLRLSKGHCTWLASGRLLRWQSKEPSGATGSCVETGPEALAAPLGRQSKQLRLALAQRLSPGLVLALSKVVERL